MTGFLIKRPRDDMGTGDTRESRPGDSGMTPPRPPPGFPAASEAGKGEGRGRSPRVPGSSHCWHLGFGLPTSRAVRERISVGVSHRGGPSSRRQGTRAPRSSPGRALCCTVRPAAAAPLVCREMPERSEAACGFVLSLADPESVWSAPRGPVRRPGH